MRYPETHVWPELWALWINDTNTWLVWDHGYEHHSPEVFWSEADAKAAAFENLHVHDIDSEPRRITVGDVNDIEADANAQKVDDAYERFGRGGDL